MSDGSRKRGGSATRRRTRRASSNGASADGRPDALRRDAPNGAAEAAAGAGSAVAQAASSGLGLAGTLAKMGAQAGLVLGQQVVNRIPTADLDERDPDYIREQLPGLWML